MQHRKHPLRLLISALVLSGTLNILLLTLFFYWTVSDSPLSSYCNNKPATTQEQQIPLANDYSNSDVIRYFRKMPTDWLVERLTNVQQVENGYTQRDLALATLVTLHHFDLNRALAGMPPPEQKRSIFYGKFRDGKPAEITAFPGLTDKHFELIQNFAKTERWPLTSEGLFIALKKKNSGEWDSSLVDAFVLTEEFLALEMLFSRSETTVDKLELVSLVVHGDWSLIAKFSEQQKVAQDLSPARRQRLLLDYIQNSSAPAAYLLLKTDNAFATHKLDDNHVCMILDQLHEKTPQSEKFALDLLTSPRSDLVWRLASKRLYEYAGETEPEKYQHQVVLSRFASPSVPQSLPPPSLSPSKPAPVIPKNKAVQPLKTAAPVTKAKPPVNTVKPKHTLTPAPKQKLTPNQSLVATSSKKAELSYVVKDGDSLWKIARRFNVDIDLLRSYNKLESDSLKPGRSLRIPIK